MPISSLSFIQQGLDAILRQSQALSDIQLKLATGKKILTAADDPSGNSKALELRQELSLINQYNINIERAQGELSLEESQLNGALNIYIDEMSALIDSITDSTNQTDRQNIAEEMQQHLDALVAIANAKKANGDYMFSGFQSEQQPFTVDTGGSYQFNGDQGKNYLKISVNNQVAISDSGYDIFHRVDAATGTFSTDAGTTNSGTGVISLGAISDSASWLDSGTEDYTITFNALNPGMNFDITADSTGSVVTGFDDVSFNAGDTITLKGVTFTISGTPQPGDVFHLKSPAKVNVFNEMKKFINTLNSIGDTTTDRARLQVEKEAIEAVVFNAQKAADSANSAVGARGRAMLNQIAVNDSAEIAATEFLGSIEGVSPIELLELSSDLTFQQNLLEAGQRSFVLIQGLSLFNLL